MSQPICSSEIPSGFPALNKLHQDFFSALNELSSSADQEFCDGYQNFVAQVERTFRLEEEWMEQIDFPVFRIHQEQHARALGALHNIHGRVMDGAIGLGRDVVDNLLPQWFALHMSTLDATLGLAMQMTQAERAQPASFATISSRDNSATTPR
jgi:hemerythrin